jgi:hypothetical protein
LGNYAFPPPSAPINFNQNAEKGRVPDAAVIIKTKMPLGQGYSLTDQQPLDIASSFNSRERPRDPRETGRIEGARRRFHVKRDYNGQQTGGDLLGDGITALISKAATASTALRPPPIPLFNSREHCSPAAASHPVSQRCMARHRDGIGEGIE